MAFGARLAHAVVVFAAFRIMRFRPRTAEDAETETRKANVLGLHDTRLSHLEEVPEDCVNSAIGLFVGGALVGR